MIEIEQGSPGSGKSAVAVARAIAHLKEGGVVAANFSLIDGWAGIVAKHSIMGKLFPEYAHKKASSLYKRFYRFDSLPAIRKINPIMEAVDKHQFKKGKYHEGSGLLIIDESQLVFNSRNSMTGSKNMDWIEFFTQHRKLGWNVILIAHSSLMIDSQIRPLAEYDSTFRNMQKIKIPVLGLPMSPIPMFIVITRYAGLGAGSSVIANRKLFPLPLWAAALYDSLLVFSADQWGKDSKPRHCGSPPDPRAVTVNIPRPRCSSLVGPHWDNYLMTPPGSVS
jgi:hypothetical protein